VITSVERVVICAVILLLVPSPAGAYASSDLVVGPPPETAVWDLDISGRWIAYLLATGMYDSEDRAYDVVTGTTADVSYQPSYYDGGWLALSDGYIASCGRWFGDPPFEGFLGTVVRSLGDPSTSVYSLEWSGGGLDMDGDLLVASAGLGQRGVVYRDEIAYLVACAHAGEEAQVPDGPGTTTFPDVPTDHWASAWRDSRGGRSAL